MYRFVDIHANNWDSHRKTGRTVVLNWAHGQRVVVQDVTDTEFRNLSTWLAHEDYPPALWIRTERTLILLKETLGNIEVYDKDQPLPFDVHKLLAYTAPRVGEE
jgi:hypothetical protein